MKAKLQFRVLTLQHQPWKQETSHWQQMEAVGFDSIWLVYAIVNYIPPNALQ